MPQSSSCREAASLSESNSADTMAAATTTTTTTTKRQAAGLKSRERLRLHQARQLRQFPFLYHRAQDLHSTCERLEQELAHSHQQAAAFRHEAFALRSLVKFTQSPELVAVAQEDATRHVMMEEVKELRCHVRRLQQEKELSLRQTEKACEAAEYYKRLCDQFCQGSLGTTVEGSLSSTEGAGTPMLNRSANSTPRAASFAPPTTLSIEEQVGQLRSALKVERARSAALEERVVLLQAAMTETTARSPHHRILELKSSAGGKEKTQEDHTSDIGANRPHVAAEDTCRGLTRLKRLVTVLRRENRLLTQRVDTVVARNIRYVKDIAALRTAYRRLELQSRQGGLGLR